METLRQQVALARRRLVAEQFLERLIWCWFVLLMVALVGVAIPKLVVVSGLPAGWSWWCLLGSVVGAVAAAVIWQLVSSRSELEAAMEIDRRFNLCERVASCLSLPASEVQSPAGLALQEDALRAIARLQVTDRFPIGMGRRAWLPLVPACLTVLLATVVGNSEAQSNVATQTALSGQELDNATKALRERLVQREKQAAAQGLEETEELFRKLHNETQQLAAQKNLDRRQALIKLNDLARELEQRREQLGGSEQLRKQLAGMKNLNQGPAEKMVDAIKQGDWKKAQSQLQQLSEKMAKGELTQQQQQALQEQMQQLEKQLQDAADSQKQAMQDLEKQIQQQQRQGNLSEANRLQEKLDQLAKQQAQAQKLSQMAQQMGECQKCLAENDAQGAAEAMQQMAQQLAEMQQQLAENQLLEGALDQLEMAKDAMACQQCQGAGCEQCQGAAAGQPSDQFGDQSGDGMGAGRGRGKRPDEQNDVKFRDSRVKQNEGQGAAVIVGEAEGPNYRGQIRQTIQEEMAALGTEPADPQVIEQLPRSRRQHTQEYFNLLRDGK
jgi:hypothetical protein